MSPPGAIRRQAPAKINLTLAVLGRRSDGFHELESWVVRIDLCDGLEFSASASLQIRVHGRSEGVPQDETNLVLRAARSLAAYASTTIGANIRLEKNIPNGAGLGGGSSDAAAALVGLNELWDLRLPAPSLATLGAGLGSDVPLFLGPPSLIMRGRGERVEDCPARPQLFVGLVIPPFAVSTAEVYRRCNPSGSATDRQPWTAGPRDLTADRLLPLLFNDLEAPAFALEPRLANLHNRIERFGNRIVRMTGSGSCLYSLFDLPAAAAAWREAVQPRLGREAEILVVRTL